MEEVLTKRKAQKATRLAWLDMVKGVAIMMVVYVHCTSQPAFINKWICTFFMPLFFIAAGYTYRLKKGFFRYNVKRVLVPYYLWGMVGVLFGIMRRVKDHDFLIGDTVTRFVAFLLGRTMDNYPLWFLVAFFVAKTVYDGINALTERVAVKNPLLFEVACVVLFTTIGYFFSQHKTFGFCLYRADDGLVMLPFFLFGKLLARYTKDCAPGKWKTAVFALVMLAGNMLFGMALNSLVSVNSSEYGNIAFFYLSAVMGTLFIFSMCRLLENVRVIVDGLAFLGKRSMDILCMHIFVLYGYEVLFLFILNISVPGVVTMVLVVATNALLIQMIHWLKSKRKQGSK